MGPPDAPTLGLMPVSLLRSRADPLLRVNTEWQNIQLGLSAQSIPIVSLYDTLGPSAVHYCLVHAEISIAFVSALHLAALLELAGDKTPLLKTVVCVDLWKGGPGGVGAKGLEEVAMAWGKEKGVHVLDLAERKSFPSVGIGIGIRD